MAALTPELCQCLPEGGPIRAYVEWASRLSHAPPILHAASILPVMSYDLCRRGYVTQHHGPPQLWFATIASAASSKTTAHSWARAFSKDWYNAQYPAEELTPKPWVSLEGSLPGVLQVLSGMYDPLLHKTVGILHHTEFSAVLRQEDASEPLRKIFDGEDYDRNLRYLQKAKDRGEDVRAQIKAPTFSAIVNTTLSDLKRVSNVSSTEGGLFSRFLWLHEHLRLEDLQPHVLSDPRGRQQVLDAWLTWTSMLEGLRVNGAALEIHWDASAHKFFTHELFEYVKTNMVADGAMSGVASRALQHAGRLASVYAVNQGRIAQDRLWVTLPDIWAAANFVARAYQAAHFLSGEISAQYHTWSDRTAIIRQAVEAAGETGLLRRDVYALFHNNTSKQEVDALIQSLVDAEGAVEQVIRTGRPGRPPVRLYARGIWEALEAKKAN